MGVLYLLVINIINREKDLSIKLWNNLYNVGFKFCYNLYILVRVYILIFLLLEDFKIGYDF